MFELATSLVAAIGQRSYHTGLCGDYILKSIELRSSINPTLATCIRTYFGVCSSWCCSIDDPKFVRNFGPKMEKMRTVEQIASIFMMFLKRFDC